MGFPVASLQCGIMQWGILDYQIFEFLTSSIDIGGIVSGQELLIRPVWNGTVPGGGRLTGSRLYAFELPFQVLIPVWQAGRT